MNLFVEDAEVDAQLKKIYKLVKKNENNVQISLALNTAGILNLETNSTWTKREIASVVKEFGLRSNSPLFLQREDGHPITKTFIGSFQDTTLLSNSFSGEMQNKNYYPSSSQYQEGAWDAGAFIVALLLCFVLVGILVFVYMLLVKPKGSLVVTYEYRQPDKVSSGTNIQPTTNTPIDSLDAIKKLGELKELGLVTEEEFQEKKALIFLKEKHDIFIATQKA